MALILPVMVSCDKSTPLTVTPSSITLYVGGTAQLQSEPSDGVRYSTSDDFYASVSPTGLVTANKFGGAVINASLDNISVDIPVVVLCQYSLYPELDKIIGQPESEVIKLLGSAYTQSEMSSGETMYIYKYFNSYTEAIAVSFKNEICSSAAALVSTSYMSQLTQYLKERYSLVAMLNDVYAFFNHDKDVVAALNVPSAYYLQVTYTPYNN